MRLSATLRAAYARADEELRDEAERIATDPRQFRRRARLAELRASVAEAMRDLDGQAATWLSTQLPVAFRIGADSAVVGASFRWTSADTESLTILARETYDDLLAATRGMDESAKAFVRWATRERALLGRIEGETAQQSARRLAKLLERHGLTAVTYRNGARHSLSDYADMVLRTVTANASNAGFVTQAGRMGVRYVEVFDGTADIACASVNGTVQTVEWAAANPLGHPRCQRAFASRVDVLTAEGASSAAPTTTAAQRADQSAADQARAAANRDRARRRAAQRRSARRQRATSA